MRTALLAPGAREIDFIGQDKVRDALVSKLTTSLAEKERPDARGTART